MKVRTLLVAILLAAAPCVPAAWAQRADEAAAPPANGRFGNDIDTARNLEDYVYGVVKKMDSAELICDKTEFGDGQPFKLDKKTKFIHDGKPSTLGNLKVGDGIWLKIRKDKKTGDLTALRVVTGVLPTEAK